MSGASRGKNSVTRRVGSAKSPAGQHKNLLCQITIMKDGEPIIQSVGQGGILRIDRAAAPKEAKNPTVASKTKEGGK